MQHPIRLMVKSSCLLKQQRARNDTPASIPYDLPGNRTDRAPNVRKPSLKFKEGARNTQPSKPTPAGGKAACNHKDMGKLALPRGIEPLFPE